jgi:hypothetical protein
MAQGVKLYLTPYFTRNYLDFESNTTTPYFLFCKNEKI